LGQNGLAVSERSPQELLSEFVQTGRQEPFEEIVRRYAGMVYHTCLQVTKDSHDAEDATQAVFLTLAVKSKTTEPIRYLGPWLQQVGKRLSLDIKRSKKRREARETRHHAMNGNGHHLDAPPQVQVDELKRVLHDELHKLPAKYRLPLILHYFGGMKPEEMARELGCKPSTLGVRLYRGRKLLADNLAGRGIVVGTALLGVAIYAVVQSIISSNLSGHQSQQASSDSSAGDVISAAVSAKVLGLISATGRGMVLSRVKAIVALVLLAGAVAGAGNVADQIRPMTQQLDQQIQNLLRPMMK
jgi:RNA polymerase sigma factor (sigma-70 family)